MSNAEIDLIPMDEADFRTYTSQSVAEYALEHIRNGRWTAEEGLQKAEAEFQQLLPDGLASQDQYLFSIKKKALREQVGILWFGVQKRGGKAEAFVYDIKIEEQFRRRGYAEQAFLALEEKVHALGFDTIGLHVFGHNHAARALYEKLGYVPINIVMSKKLNS